MKRKRRSHRIEPLKALMITDQSALLTQSPSKQEGLNKTIEMNSNWTHREQTYRGRLAKMTSFDFKPRIKSLTPSKWDESSKTKITFFDYHRKPRPPIYDGSHWITPPDNPLKEVEMTDVRSIDVDKVKEEIYYTRNLKIHDRIQLTFDRKMDKLNHEILQHIDNTSQKYRDNIKVLEFQQKLQKDPSIKLKLMGRSDYFTVKNEYKRAFREQLRDKLRQQKADDQTPVEPQQDQNQEIVNSNTQRKQIKQNSDSNIGSGLGLGPFKGRNRLLSLNLNTQSNLPSALSFFSPTKLKLDQSEGGRLIPIKPQSYTRNFNDMVYQQLKSTKHKEQSVDRSIMTQSYQGDQESELQDNLEQRLNKYKESILQQTQQNKIDEVSESEFGNSNVLYNEIDDDEGVTDLLQAVNGTFKANINKYLEDQDEPLQSKKVAEFRKEYQSQRQKQEQMDILVHSTKPKIREALKDDARFKFIEICKKENVAPISILHQLTRSRIVIKDVKLNLGLCKALALTINEMEQFKLKYLYLENNGFEDECFPTFIEKLKQRAELQSVIFVNNELGQATIEALIDMIEDLSYLKFNQLRLANCKLRIPTSDFLDQLEKRAPLRKLALVSMELNDQNLNQIVSYLKNNPNLIDLDLSWNKFKPNALVKFLEFLRKINQVQSLNLSWNSLRVEDERALKQSISSLIQYSSNLQHLDLSNTMLRPSAILAMVHQMQKSLTLISVHLSGNQISPQLKSKIKNFLRLKPYDSNKDLQEVMINSTVTDNASQSELIIDTFNKKSIREEALAQKNQLAYQSSFDTKLVLWRMIGNPELCREQGNKNSLYEAQWYESEQCWVCDRWRYFMTCCFESEFSSIMKPDEVGDKAFQKLMNYLPQSEKNRIEPSSYYVIGSFTQWRFIKMQKLLNLILQIDPNAKSIQETKKSEADLWKYYKGIWKFKLQKGLHYKPFFDRIISRPLTENDQVWIYNEIVPPGKHQYFIIYSDEFKLLKKLYFTSLVKARKEDIKKCALLRQLKKQKVRRFIKNESVFKEWMEPNKAQMAKIMEHDSQLWKVGRLIKDTEDLRLCKELLASHMPFLINMFRYLISTSNYPQISWNDFTAFGNQLNLFDASFGLSTFDRLFIATNVQLNKGGKGDESQGSTQELRRFEFFEILVRIAGAKYKDSSQNKTYHEALAQLLEDNLIPAYKTIANEADLIRRNEIWQLDVNDTLSVNLQSLKKLYTMHQQTGKEKAFTIQSVKNILDKTSYGLMDKDLIHCFAQSKMILIQDSDRSSYLRLALVEFLDFLCRVSTYLIPNGTSIGDKIKVLVKNILISHGLKYIEFTEDMLQDDDNGPDYQSDEDFDPNKSSEEEGFEIEDAGSYGPELENQEYE